MRRYWPRGWTGAATGVEAEIGAGVDGGAAGDANDGETPPRRASSRCLSSRRWNRRTRGEHRSSGTRWLVVGELFACFEGGVGCVDRGIIACFPMKHIISVDGGVCVSVCRCVRSCACSQPLTRSLPDDVKSLPPPPKTSRGTGQRREPFHLPSGQSQTDSTFLGGGGFGVISGEAPSRTRTIKTSKTKHDNGCGEDVK